MSEYSISELRRHLAGDTVLNDGEKDEYLAALLEVAEAAEETRTTRGLPVRMRLALERFDFEEAS